MNLKEPLHFLRKALSVRKTWNVVKVMTSYGLSRLTSRPFVWGVPPVLMIEPTDICNLKCPLCPSGNGSLTRAKGFIDRQLFRRIVDEIAERTHMLLLWNQGESMMHRDFLEMVRYASERGLYTMVSTNGHYLRDPEAIIGSGLDSLIVSLDGATPETYRTYRVGGIFEKVIEGTKALVAAKRRLRSRTPIIHLQFILFKHNEHEVSQVYRLARELGVDKITYKTAQIYRDEEIQAFLPDRKEFRRYEVRGGSFKLKNGVHDGSGVPNKCRALWLQPVVNWDGTVTPCCFDKDAEFAMGEFRNGTSFERLWNSEQFNAFRKRILSDRAQIEMCRNCTEGIKTNYDERDIVVR